MNIPRQIPPYNPNPPVSVAAATVNFTLVTPERTPAGADAVREAQGDFANEAEVAMRGLGHFPNSISVQAGPDQDTSADMAKVDITVEVGVAKADVVRAQELLTAAFRPRETPGAPTPG